jgi:nucleoside-diphosphate-sugar epimerase
MNLKQKALVTGGTGFVGQHLLQRLLTEPHYVPIAPTRLSSGLPLSIQSVVVGDINGHTDWTQALAGVDAVVHTAARVHVMKEAASDPLAAFRLVNVQGTLNLARQAAAKGVRRFVFISSVKVNGESTVPGVPFAEHMAPAPQDAYGISKLEAEQGLREIANLTGMDVVIIRPPLIYGPGVKANFAALLAAVKLGIPLPLGAVHNARSLVGLDNLIDFIVTCITHARAANQTFMVSDGQDLSTTELIRGMAQGAGVSARLVPLPMWTLNAGARFLGKRDAIQRLCGNLQVDITKARDLLAWVPPVSVSEGLRRTVEELNVK